MSAPENTPSTIRCRFCLSTSYRPSKGFTAFAKTYVPTFNSDRWAEFRQVLLDLYVFIKRGTVSAKGSEMLVRVARPIIYESLGSERFYVPAAANKAYKQFYEPGELLEVAYRLHQAGKSLDEAISKGLLKQYRDKLLNEVKESAK